jgi:hypothetical protein
MNIVESIVNGDLTKFKELVYEQLFAILDRKLDEQKKSIANESFDYELEELDEAKSLNIVKSGRIQKIRRRIRRNAKGRIVVQKNVKRSAIKGYRLGPGGTVKRIPVAARIHKTRMMKRYWKTKGRAKLRRTLMKRKMSMRRRKSMGIR